MVERPLRELDTEARAGQFEDLGDRATHEVVRAVVAGHDAVVAAVLEAADQIATLADAAAERLARGGRVIYAGAGAAGRAAATDASEWAPTFNVPERTVIALLAGAHASPGSAAEAAAEDDAAAGAAELDRQNPGPADLVIGVSASGRTPYTLGVLKAARDARALTGAIVCQSGSPLAELADYPVHVPVGPEIVAGSSRLKAGTAQKLVLNAFSTAVMARRGRILGNLMGCLRISNEKLRQRAEAVCQAATGCDPAAARRALEESGDTLEVALVMLRAQVDAGAARAALEATGGHLPHALERLAGEAGA